MTCGKKAFENPLGAARKPPKSRPRIPKSWLLGQSWGLLGRSWGDLGAWGRSWGDLGGVGASWGGLGEVLGSILATSGESIASQWEPKGDEKRKKSYRNSM